MTDTTITGDLGTHAPTPQPGNSFALQSTCSTCQAPILWRLGTGEWEHSP